MRATGEGAASTRGSTGAVRELLACAAFAAVLWGCGDEGIELRTNIEREKSVARGPIAATVDGDPIPLSEVQELVDATDLHPSAALRRLEDERLLAKYAEQRGYGQDVAASRELKQARSRALLAAAVEQGTAANEIAIGEVQGRFEEVSAREKRFDQRAVTHVLFRTEKGRDPAPAKAAAEKLLGDLRGRSSLAERVALLESIDAQGARDGVSFVRESFDAAQDGRLEKPFSDAAFAPAEVGPVPRVVETSFGFHVILVRELKPAEPFLLSAHEADLRKQLSIEKRKEKLEKLIEELRTKDPVVLDEELIKRALADESLLGNPP